MFINKLDLAWKVLSKQSRNPVTNILNGYDVNHSLHYTACAIMCDISAVSCVFPYLIGQKIPHTQYDLSWCAFTTIFWPWFWGTVVRTDRHSSVKTHIYSVMASNKFVRSVSITRYENVGLCAIATHHSN